MIKSVDDALCEDKGYGLYKLAATVKEVFWAFRKFGIIASSKKLIIGNSVEFGDAVITGNSDGVTIGPNMPRIVAIRNMRRPKNRKEVQVYLGTVRSLLKWFPGLNIGASITKVNSLHGQK